MVCRPSAVEPVLRQMESASHQVQEKPGVAAHHTPARMWGLSWAGEGAGSSLEVFLVESAPLKVIVSFS